MAITNINLITPEELITRFKKEISCYTLKELKCEKVEEETLDDIEQLQNIIVLKMKGINLKSL
jgi:hypothetical protein